MKCDTNKTLLQYVFTLYIEFYRPGFKSYVIDPGNTITGIGVKVHYCFAVIVFGYVNVAVDYSKVFSTDEIWCDDLLLNCNRRLRNCVESKKNKANTN